VYNIWELNFAEFSQTIGYKLMKNTLVTKLTALTLSVLGSFGTASVTLAQASEQNETRFLQEAIKLIYEEDKDQTFTAQEILNDGYKLCEKMAAAEAEAESEDNNLGGLAQRAAQGAISSALGGEDSSDESNESADMSDSEMMKIAERYLCNE
jgi:hypothetical protein